jgi:hypothetical protein
MNKSSMQYFGQSSLGYANYNFDKHGYTPDPKPTHNAGIYGGEAFKAGAGWSNIPVIPSTDYMTHINLISANPPDQALYQYPHTVRPGNSFQKMEGIGYCRQGYNIQGIITNVKRDKCDCQNECSCGECRRQGKP